MDEIQQETVCIIYQFYSKLLKVMNLLEGPPVLVQHFRLQVEFTSAQERRMS